MVSCLETSALLAISSVEPAWSESNGLQGFERHLLISFVGRGREGGDLKLALPSKEGGGGVFTDQHTEMVQ